MQRFNTITSSINFFLCVLLIFLSLFYSKIELPTWMMPLGRMHAMILHLPIGMFGIYLLFTFFSKSIKKEDYANIQSTILNVACGTALIAALFGLFLSAEKNNYNADEIYWHKMSGTVFAILLFILSTYFQKMKGSIKDFLTASIAVLLFVAGHKGAEITHGQDYLFPSEKKEKKVVDANAPVYEKYVYPILENKCVSCHNTQKTKGGLLMTDTTSFKKGGENGPIVIAGNIEKSNLIKYINLPLDDKLHMAPKGKPQLTKDEIDLLTEWVKEGASFSYKEKNYPENSSFKKLFSKLASTAEVVEKTYDFDAVNPDVVKKLASSNRTVSQVNYGSPALQAKYILAAGFDHKTISDLKEVKQQLVHLNLSNMPMEDKDLSILSDFESLERLYLNNSKISSLKSLGKLKNLEVLSVINTKLNNEESLNLSSFPNLKKIFLGGCGIKEDAINKLQKKYPKIYFDKGYSSNELLKLTPPILDSKTTVLEQNAEIKLKHNISGVKIRFTLDGKDVDSTSQLYTKPFKIDSTTNIQARAFADGWKKSDSIDVTIFKMGHKADFVELNTKPNVKYTGNGASNLTDGKRADKNNNLDMLWLGFQENPFSATFTFDKKPTINKMILCISMNIFAYIMPPREITVYGGDTKNEMKVIRKIAYAALKESELNSPNFKVIPMPTTNYKYYKVMATVEQKLPSWHPGKGEKGWVFVDEVFFY